MPVSKHRKIKNKMHSFGIRKAKREREEMEMRMAKRERRLPSIRDYMFNMKDLRKMAVRTEDKGKGRNKRNHHG